MNLLDKETIKNTLETFAGCDMQMTTTAKKLFIHYYTLNHRLATIKKQTGLNPKNFHDLAMLLGYKR